MNVSHNFNNTIMRKRGQPLGSPRFCGSIIDVSSIILWNEELLAEEGKTGVASFVMPHNLSQ